MIEPEGVGVRIENELIFIQPLGQDEYAISIGEAERLIQVLGICIDLIAGGAQETVH